MLNLERYLGSQLLAILPLDADGRLDLGKLSWMSALGWLWSAFLLHVVPAYQHLAAIIPLHAVVLFWLLDMITGSAKVVRLGGWRKWSPERARLGLAKLVLWGCVLAVTYILRESHTLGAAWFAGIVESYIIFTEAGSVLRNLGSIWGHRGIETAGEFAEDRAETLLEQARKK